MSTSRELCRIHVQVKRKFASGVGHSKVPDASDEWRSAGFTQYLANTDDEFCSSWELELSVSNWLLTALAHCFYRSRVVRLASLSVKCSCVLAQAVLSWGDRRWSAGSRRAAASLQQSHPTTPCGRRCCAFLPCLSIKSCCLAKGLCRGSGSAQPKGQGAQLQLHCSANKASPCAAIGTY